MSETPIINELSNLGVSISEKPFDKDQQMEHLRKIENLFSISIPDDYKEFLLLYNQVLFENYITISPKVLPELGGHILEELYGLDCLSYHMNRYSDRIPSSFIPIGECVGGDLVLIGIKEDSDGKVFIWDHENELQARLMLGEKVEADLNSYKENLHLISQTFVEFLSILEIDDNDDLELDGVEIWLDDDLLDD
ncbi:SMI1/KNR4 family protein [Pontibacillus marinus]|uniref:Knr4/Smi1-like domain-containing protein n=1 Tax=Pontibacillus marinus BH030004 = DSM 16465 TaxID=1385511 RepID=A0A0A5GJ52_9BACI|nr:SMI1/KNR4 family protein [Pontibacillus marinus]KGX91258.1 hypothetical protein N783_10965 [Pontibacillus marinus BH030004 = DSM 16465]